MKLITSYGTTLTEEAGVKTFKFHLFICASMYIVYVCVWETDHPFHAMWEQHDKAGLADPLWLAWGDELVNDALGCVVEVTKLSLPQHQGIGVGHGEA